MKSTADAYRRDFPQKYLNPIRNKKSAGHFTVQRIFCVIPQLFSLEVVVSVVVTPFSVVVVVVVVSPFTVVETVEVEVLDVVHAARAKIITHTSRSTKSFFMINSSFK